MGSNEVGLGEVGSNEVGSKVVGSGFQSWVRWSKVHGVGCLELGEVELDA